MIQNHQMKKALFFFLLSAILFSCSKSKTTPEPKIVVGILYYQDPASDGAGLYFLTDSAHEYLYFYDSSGDHFNDPDDFKDSLNKHLRLTYLDEGRRGCPWCQVPVVPVSMEERIVKLISLTKD